MTEKIEYRLFLWGYCSMCGAHIVCPNCGTNTCSGSFGYEDGTPAWGNTKSGRCKTCNLAYQYAHLCYEHGLAPKNKRQVAAFNKKIIQKEG